MAIKSTNGALPTYNPDLYKEKQRLEFTNSLLAEEARLAKDALKVALDKLGVDWNPASRDYTVMQHVLSVSALPDVERLLNQSEERRAEALHTIVQLRRSVEQVLQDRDEVLMTLTRHFPNRSYRCNYLGNDAVVIETDLGNACWYIGAEVYARFSHLEEQPAPRQILSRQERTAALLMMTLSGSEIDRD